MSKYFWASGLNESAPVYITRKSASGETGTYSMSLWMSLLAMMLVWLNVVAWSIVGLVFAVEQVA